MSQQSNLNLQEFYDEKRNFQRMQTDAAVCRLKVKDGSEMISGKCENLSADGVCIITNQAISVGTKLQIAMPGAISDLKAIATVNRCSFDELKNEYTIACKIDKLF